MKVLLTGANGYIGMRLLPVLLLEGHEVHCVVRSKSRFALNEQQVENVFVHEADFLRPETLQNLPTNMDAAYYLIHSLSQNSTKFAELEERSAHNFVAYIERTTARQVIFLGGIDNAAELSKHLASRQRVDTLLASSSVPLTTLKAGIIVGSGSASFEIIRDLVEKLPVMVAPKWINTRCQPIAIRNVVNYLSKVLLHPDAIGQDFEIGGPDILTYKEMLLQFGEVRGLVRHIVSVPVLSPRLSSYWLYFVTATSYPLARNLVDSMRVEVVCKENRITEIIPQRLIPYKEAVGLAFQKIEQNMVVSSWKDAMVSSMEDGEIQAFLEVPKHGCFKDQKIISLTRPAEEVLNNIWSIGGTRGWYYGNWMWKIRGYLDKLAGGIGLRRGRRSPTELKEGDALDFWRVIVADRNAKRLLLYAEMKLPGEAWLEFRILGTEGKYALKQEATFRPRGLKGRLYWYSVLPFHWFVFDGMIRNIHDYKP